MHWATTTTITVHRFDACEAIAEVLQKASLHRRIDAPEASHLGGAFREPGLEFVEHSRIGGLSENGLLPLQVL